MSSLYWPLVVTSLVLYIVGSPISAHELYDDDGSREEYSPYLATVIRQLEQYDLPELEDVYFTNPGSYILDLESEGSLDGLHRRMRRRHHLNHRFHHYHHHHHRPRQHSHRRFEERLKRQAELEGSSIEKAKAKLKHALQAAKALGGMEKQMGLDPSVIEQKTTHIKDDLSKEVTKYKEEELSDDMNEEKRAKLKQYSDFAKKDMKEADSILSLIVKLEAAKYIAAERAREELQKAERSRIHSPPVLPQSPPYAAPSPVSSFQSPYQLPNQPQYHPQMAPSTGVQQSSFTPSSHYGPYFGPFNDQPVQRPLQYSTPLQGPTFGPSIYPESPNIASYTTNVDRNQDKNDVQTVHSVLHPLAADEQAFTESESNSPDINSAGLVPLEKDESTVKLGGGLDQSGAKSAGDLEPSLPAPLDTQPNKERSGKSKNDVLNPKSQKVNGKDASELPKSVAKATPTESLAKEIATEGVPNDSKVGTLTNMFTTQSTPLSTARPGKENFAHLAPLSDSFGSSATQYSPKTFNQRFNSQSPTLLESHFQASPQYVESAVPSRQLAGIKSSSDLRSYSNMHSPQPAAAPMISNYFDYQSIPQQAPFQQRLSQYQPESSYPWQAPSSEKPSFYWPQQAPQAYQPSWPSNQATYGYQPLPANPKVVKAEEKVNNVKKASIAVTNLEKFIGLTPGTVNNLIDGVEQNAKGEVVRYEQDIARQKSKIESEKKLIQNDETNGSVEEIQKRIEDHEKKLDNDKQKEQAAERKLNEIKQIEKVLTVIEAAKYSALQRAKTRLQELDAQKDILRIRKRDLEEESGLTDLKRHRRNEINIFLHGSRNKIDASRLVQRKKVFNRQLKKRVKNNLKKEFHHKKINSVTMDTSKVKPHNTFVPPDFDVKKSNIHKKIKHHRGKSKDTEKILKKIDRLFLIGNKIMEKLNGKSKKNSRKDKVKVLDGGVDDILKKRSVRATSMKDVHETLQE